MLNENYLEMTEGVRIFLTGLGYGQYYDMFMARGFDSESDICYLNNDDMECMYITDHVHRREILQAARHFKPSQEFAVYEWLREKGLEHYFINFVQSDLTDFDVISRLNLPDENIYDELEITLPGHKRRLERAVQQLSKKKRSEPAIKEPVGSSAPKALTSGHVHALEMPLAYGRWGKPRCLLDAKYDFLVLDAVISSTTDPRNNVQIEFMVDSGSDVVTIREELLDSLDLELIGPIKSKGVHASRTKNLYKANIHIGNETLEIEVMGESYDSIGSRVIRHFRHYVNGSRHIWLKGDFVDPTMSPKTLHSSEDSQVMISSGTTSESSSQGPASGTSAHSSQCETEMTPKDARVFAEDVIMATRKSPDQNFSGADDSNMIVTDSGLKLQPSSREGVSIDDPMENVAREMERNINEDGESTEDRVVEIIPVEVEGNKKQDQVDGINGLADIFVSSIGRPRQHFLVREEGVFQGIQIYEGTSRAATLITAKSRKSEELLYSQMEEEEEEGGESSGMDSNTDR